MASGKRHRGGDTELEPDTGPDGGSSSGSGSDDDDTPAQQRAASSASRLPLAVLLDFRAKRMT